MGRRSNQCEKELVGHYAFEESGKRRFVPGDLATSLDKEQDPAPFRGMRPHATHVGSWLLHYKGEYLGTAAKTDWSRVFTTLTEAQKNQEKGGTSSASSTSSGSSPKGTLTGHQLRLPRLTYFAVGAVVQDGLQGDLASAAEAEVSHQVMFTAEPGLWLVSLQGKYWPWKLALAESWAACQKPPAVQEVPEPEPSRADKFWRVLHRAVQLMDGRPYHQWHNHCGRGVAFHSGFLKLVQDLGLVVISPPAGAQPKAWEPVQLSCTAGRQHHLRAASTSSASCPPEVQSQVEKYLAAADLLNIALSSPPRTCQEYISKFKVFQQGAASLKAPHVGGGYTVPWTFRSAAVARMRAKSLEALSEPEAVSPADFAAAFPDQNDWISQLQGSSSCQTLADFLKVLGYQGPPELLTMKLCLHLEADLQLYNPSWLWKHADQLHEGARELAEHLGFFPHIAVYLQLLREQWHSTQAKWPKLSLKLAAMPAVPAVTAVPAAPAVLKRIRGKSNDLSSPGHPTKSRATLQGHLTSSAGSPATSPAAEPEKKPAAVPRAAPSGSLTPPVPKMPSSWR